MSYLINRSCNLFLVQLNQNDMTGDVVVLTLTSIAIWPLRPIYIELQRWLFLTQTVRSVATNESIHMDTWINDFCCDINLNGEVILTLSLTHHVNRPLDTYVQQRTFWIFRPNDWRYICTNEPGRQLTIVTTTGVQSVVTDEWRTLVICQSCPKPATVIDTDCSQWRPWSLH